MKTKSLTLENNLMEKNMCNEMTDAQREAIVYRSKLLNKYYESYDDMLRDEAEFKRQTEEKEKAKLEKSSDAKKVEEAYKHVLEVRKKACLEIQEAEKAYESLKDEFVKKYGAYHMSYTNTDGQETITVSDLMNHLIRLF